MIAEIIPEAYDAIGRKHSCPNRKKARTFRPTFPMGKYVSKALSVKCSDFEDIRKFLLKCRYVSDEEQFGKKDYWLPPEEFEKSLKGDCEDYALWTWRQLLTLGYPARFVVGLSGIYGEGHAWVTMEENGKQYLVEPLACLFKRLPRMSLMR